MSKEVKVGDRLYQIEALPALRAFTLQSKVAPIAIEIVDGLGGVLKNVKGTLKDFLEQNVLDLLPLATPVLSRVFAKLTETDLEEITKTLLWNTRCNGQCLFTQEGSGSFDVVMRGRPMETWQLLFHAIQVNYPDFFEMFAGKGKAVPAQGGSEA